jgi:hypothetical protein
MRRLLAFLLCSCSIESFGQTQFDEREIDAIVAQIDTIAIKAKIIRNKSKARKSNSELIFFTTKKRATPSKIVLHSQFERNIVPDSVFKLPVFRVQDTLTYYFFQQQLIKAVCTSSSNQGEPSTTIIYYSRNLVLKPVGKCAPEYETPATHLQKALALRHTYQPQKTEQKH